MRRRYENNDLQRLEGKALLKKLGPKFSGPQWISISLSLSLPISLAVSLYFFLSFFFFFSLSSGFDEGPRIPSFQKAQHSKCAKVSDTLGHAYLALQ